MKQDDATIPDTAPAKNSDEFAQEAEQPPISLWQEFCYLIVHEKKWWLIPILIAIAFIAIAVVFSTSAALPFIYTL